MDGTARVRAGPRRRARSWRRRDDPVPRLRRTGHRPLLRRYLRAARSERTAGFRRAAPTNSMSARAASAVTTSIVRRGPVTIEVLAQGAGPLVVLLPSLGRGATDFDVMADRIADAGYRVLRPQPRG